jgi:hypothetical protein
MTWLANLDAKAKRWPVPAYIGYLGVKWYLVAVGALALAGVLADRVGIWSLY